MNIKNNNSKEPKSGLQEFPHKNIALTPEKENRKSPLTTWAYLAGIITTLVGIIVLIGYQLDIAVLKTFGRGTELMKANAAAGFIMAGLALVIMQRPNRFANFIVGFLAILIMLVGALSLSRHFFGFDIGLEDLLFRYPPQPVGSPHPGLMAPTAALNFFLVGLALLLLTLKRLWRNYLVEFSLVFSLTISAIGLIGHIIGLPQLAGPASYAKMAVNTTITFIFLCMGIIITVLSRQRRPFTIEQKFFAGLTISTTIIIFITFLFLSGFHSLRQASKWVENTQLVKNQIAEIFHLVLDVQSGDRGFILTGNEKHLEAHHKAEQELPILFQNIRNLTADNPLQQMRLNDLEKLVNERMDFSTKRIASYKTDGEAKSRILFPVSTGELVVGKIRTLVKMMIDEEDRLLQIRNKKEEVQVTQTQKIIFLSLLVQAMLLVIIFLIVRRYIRIRRKTEETLSKLNEELECRVKERTVELRQASEEIMQERDKALQYFETAGVMMVVLNSDGNVAQINKKGCEVLGYTADEIIGKDWFESFLPEYVEKDVRSVFEKIMNGSIEGVEFYENPVVNRNGEERLIAWHNTILKDSDGKPIGTLSSGEDITERKKAEIELRKANRVYAVLSNINQTIVRLKDKQTLYNEVCRIAVDDGKFRMACIGLLDEQTNKIIPVAAAGYAHEYIKTIDIDLSDQVLGDGPIGRCIKTGVHYVANDIANDPEMIPWRENILQLDSKSLATFPINVFGKTIGVFLIYAEEKHFFDEVEVKLLDELAMDISFAVEFLENEAKRLKAENRKIRQSEILEAIVKETPLPTILERIVKSVEEEDPTSLCSILLLDDEGKHLLNGASPGLPDFYNQAIHGLEIGENVGSCGASAWSKQRVIVEDILTHPNWEPFRELAQQAKLRSCWSEPILDAQGKVLGTFAIYHREPRQPLKEEIELLQSVVNLANLAISNKLAIEKITHQTEDLQLINSLNNAINRGDKLEDIIGMMSKEVMRIFKAFGTITFFPDADKNQLFPKHVQFPSTLAGKLDELVGGSFTSLPLKIDLTANEIIASAMKQGIPKAFNNADEIKAVWAKFTDNQMLKEIAAKVFAMLDFRSMILLPMVSNNEIIGMLEIDRSEITTNEELKRLEVITGQLTQAIGRKLAEEKIRNMNAELELKVAKRTEELAQTNKNLQEQIEISKQAEIMIKNSEEKHRTLFETMVQGVVYQDREGKIFSVNPAAEKILGLTLKQFQGIDSIDPRWKAIHEDGTDFPGENHPSMVALRTGKEVRNVMMGVFNPKLNMHVWLNVSATPQFDKGETKPFRVYTTFEDITGLKKAEAEIKQAKAEAERANLAKSEFLSRMSHELRTPLNSILGFAQLMKMGELDPKHKKGVDHILKSGKHLLDLINEVLDLSRIEAGKIDISLEPVQLSRIIPETLDVIRLLASSRNIKLELAETPSNDLFVKADRQKLKQVLLNLLNNAVKYNREGGTVTIEVGRPKTEDRRQKTEDESYPQYGTLRISVTDTGKGIAPEDLPKLFSPFQRIGAEVSEVEGTGLGLAVAKKLIEAMNGTIGVESKPGVGSTFWIELPQTEGQIDHHERKGDLIRPDDKSSVSGTLLYIEDNLSNIQLVEQILETHRPQIRLITEMYGQRTVSLAIDYKPDMILLDLDLPDIHGSKVLQQLLENKETKSIPVVILSADAMNSQIESLLKAGAKDYLTKPLNVIEFLRVVDEKLGNRR